MEIEFHGILDPQFMDGFYIHIWFVSHIRISYEYQLTYLMFEFYDPNGSQKVTGFHICQGSHSRYLNNLMIRIIVSGFILLSTYKYLLCLIFVFGSQIVTGFYCMYGSHDCFRFYIITGSQYVYRSHVWYGLNQHVFESHLKYGSQIIFGFHTMDGSQFFSGLHFEIGLQCYYWFYVKHGLQYVYGLHLDAGSHIFSRFQTCHV